MRRWLVALAAVLLLLGLGLALAVRNLDAYLNANRDTLARQAAAALGREVEFGEVGVSLRGGLGVRVADLRIGDDPTFSADPFLGADALEVRVAILPALRGRIEVERVVLRTPTITLIETAQGLSTTSLGRAAGPSGAAPEAPASAPASGALAVALVDIQDGTIRYLDRRSRPPVETVLQDVDFRASDPALDAPVVFELEAAVLGSKRQNLRASGRVGPVSAPVPSVDLTLALAPLDLTQALASPPLAGRAPAGLAASGTARVELRAKGSAAELALEASVDGRDAELRVGDGFAKPRGRPLSLALSARRRGERIEIARGELVLDAARLELRGSVEDLASPKLQLHLSSPAGSLLGLDYRDLALALRASGARVEVSKLALAAHAGTLEATGKADLRAPGGPVFEARAAIEGMSVESLLAAHAPRQAGRASGRLSAQLALHGAGASWPALSRRIAGGGELGVAEGVLRGFNPARDALRALAGIPVFSDRKLERLFASHPQVFGAEDTAFERIEAPLGIANGQVTARDASLLARDYSISGGGRYTFAGRLDSSAVMAFSKPLSDAVVDLEKKLRWLRSPDGRIELPVVISGVPGDLSVQPDVATIAATVSREAVTGVVERVLVGPERDGGPQSPPPKLEEAGRDLLRRGFGGLLGGKDKE